MRRLYNMLFPIWFLFFWPSWFLLLIIPGNFIIDSLALYVISKIESINFKELWKKSIIKVWIIGFFSDMIGGLFLLMVVFIFEYLGIYLNWSSFPYATFLAIPGVIVSGLLILMINRKYSFTKIKLTKTQLKETTILIALITAPYLMMIPLI